MGNESNLAIVSYRHQNKPRRGAVESQEEWVITPDVLKKSEEGFR